MNEYRVYFSDTAKKCLFDIAEHIALDNPVRAKSFVKELSDSIYNRLSVFPLSSPLYPGINTISIRVYETGEEPKNITVIIALLKQ